MLAPIIIMFLAGAGLVFAAYAAILRVPTVLAGRRLDRRLQEVSTLPIDVSTDGDTVVKQRSEGPLPGVDRLASRTAAGSRLAKYIEQSGVRTTVSALGLMTLALAAVAGLLAYLFGGPWFLALIAASVGAVVPISVIAYRRSSRLRKMFLELPQAGRSAVRDHGDGDDRADRRGDQRDEPGASEQVREQPGHGRNRQRHQSERADRRADP